MSLIVDITERKFGRLTALHIDGKNHRRKIMWKCLCDCGNIKTITGEYLRSGRTRSCGCLQKETKLKNINKRNVKHGMYLTPEYKSWIAMKERCLNKNNNHYKDYGGRNIKICKEWKNSFETFYKDIGKKPSKDHSLDRIDVFGNYEPSNCRWATRSQQIRNRRISIPKDAVEIIELIQNKYNLSYANAYKKLRRLLLWIEKSQR